MKVKEGLFRQYSIGHAWGRFALAGTQISIFVTGYTFLMVSISAYPSVSSWLKEYQIVLSLGLYMVVVALPIVIAYLLSWKFLVKSFYLSWAEQFWRESKEYLRDIEMLKEQNAEILKILEGLRGKG